MSGTRSERRAPALLVALVLATAAPLARAEPKAEARALYEEGARLYDLGSYDDAIDRFERAYTLTGAPVLLVNLAQAYRKKGDCARAAWLYGRYLSRSPNGELRKDVEARRAEMERCAREEKDASAATEGNERKEPSERREEPAPTPAAAPPPAPPAPPRGASGPVVLAWSGVALASLGAATAAVTGGMALDRAASLRSACDADHVCPRTEADRLDTYETLRTIAFAGVVAAVVGASAAVVGFVLARPRGGVRATALLEGRF